MTSPLHQAISRELQAARLARQAGNEGRARVCARRAAGLAAQAYLSRRGVQIEALSAFRALEVLSEFPGTPEETAPLLDHLTRRVDLDFSLPAQVDPIADASRLVDLLA